MAVDFSRENMVRHDQLQAAAVGGPRGRRTFIQPFDPPLPPIVPFITGVRMDENNDVPLFDPESPIDLTVSIGFGGDGNEQTSVIALERSVISTGYFAFQGLGSFFGASFGETEEEVDIQVETRLTISAVTVPMLGPVTDPFNISKLKFSLQPTVSVVGGASLSVSSNFQTLFPNNVNNTILDHRILTSPHLLGFFSSSLVGQTIFGLLFSTELLTIQAPDVGILTNEVSFFIKNPAAETVRQLKGHAINDVLLPEIV